MVLGQIAKAYGAESVKSHGKPTSGGSRAVRSLTRTPLQEPSEISKSDFLKLNRDKLRNLPQTDRHGKADGRTTGQLATPQQPLPHCEAHRN